MRRILFIFGVVCVLATPARLHAWGFDAHKFIMDRAIALLPPELRPLFEANRAIVVEHAIDPDLWREQFRVGSRSRITISTSTGTATGRIRSRVCREISTRRSRSSARRRSTATARCRGAPRKFTESCRRIRSVSTPRIVWRASTSCSTRRGWLTTSAMRTCRCTPSSITTVRRHGAARHPHALRSADVRALREQLKLSPQADAPFATRATSPSMRCSRARSSSRLLEADREAIGDRATSTTTPTTRRSSRAVAACWSGVWTNRSRPWPP